MSAPRGLQQAAGRNFYDDARARLQAEREATQKVTRELHGQVQEARDTLGELERTMATASEWTGELGDGFKDTFEDLVNQRTREVNDHFQKCLDRVNEKFATLTAKLEHFTGLVIAAEHEALGLPDKQKVMDILVRRITEVTHLKLNEEEFRAAIAAHVAEELNELWGAAKATTRRRGQVIVRTAQPGERLGMYVEGHYVEGSG